MRAKLVIALLLAGTTLALAHSWYPANCCSDKDCHPVPCESLVELKNGDLSYDDGKGEMRFAAGQIHPSQDRFCHVCYNEFRTPYCAFIITGN